MLCWIKCRPTGPFSHFLPDTWMQISNNWAVWHLHTQSTPWSSFLTFVYFIRAVLEVPFSFLLSLPGCSFIALSELKWSGAELVSSEVTSPPSRAFCSSEKLLDPANSCPAVLISAGSASTASPGGQRISCQNKSTIVPHWQQWMNILRETKREFFSIITLEQQTWSKLWP